MGGAYKAGRLADGRPLAIEGPAVTESTASPSGVRLCAIRPSMKPDTPFDSIESSHEYVGMLADAIDEAMASIDEEIALATSEDASRRAEALKLVAFKLKKLRDHITSSHRILNDLRTLRRLLLAERQRTEQTASADHEA